MACGAAKKWAREGLELEDACRDCLAKLQALPQCDLECFSILCTSGLTGRAKGEGERQPAEILQPFSQ